MTGRSYTVGLKFLKNYEDLQVHLDNEHVQAHVQKLNDEFLCGPIEVIIYCNWTEKQKKALATDCRNFPDLCPGS